MYGVILAGGSGTRLWPLSREHFPKQCIKTGSGMLSLFQEAAARLQEVVAAKSLLVVTHRDQKEQIALQLAELMLDQAVILEEPLARNTAPAIGLAAWYLARLDPGAVMAVLPSDHYIAPRQNFRDLLRIAGSLAERYGLVTFGIKPETPETGYGYIKCGPALPGAGYRVAAFVEKPGPETAREYLAAGNYLWNSGIFVFKVDRLQGEYRRLLPELSRLLDGLDLETMDGLEQAYAQMPKISVDYAILEKAGEIIVLPATFTWSDLGSWEAYYQVSPKDQNGNHCSGRVIAADTTGSLILARSPRLVCTVGVQDLAIIDTDDALLVCPRSCAQDVGTVVARLQAEKSKECLSHPYVERPWGNYSVLQEGENYKVKQISVQPGKRLSLQQHRHRAEHWTVVNGRALVTVDDKQYELSAGESIAIPRLAMHRVENREKEMLRFIEVQNGDYLGEDDIERLADDFGRVPVQAKEASAQASGTAAPAAGLQAKQCAFETGQQSRPATTEAMRLYERWLQSDLVDNRTKDELRSFAGNMAEIEERFGGELTFGTGGIRGILGAGTRRINTWVVQRATQGFADFLNSRFSEFAAKKAAVAYDSRHFSREFALEAALVLAANGIQALLFREMRPTPHLSFAIRELGCLGGIIITASHNPPNYNGFKVYDEYGGQIVPARAEEISAAISQVDYFNDVRLLETKDAEAKGLLLYLGEEMDARYIERLKTLSLQPGDAEMGIVYTPLHGTGVFLVPRLLRELGYENLHLVTEQANPDPDFSTVKVPNPEERDSFALSLILADATDAELILATDPDADRVGCAVRDREGAYHLLDGNRMGALLIAYLLQRLQEKNALPPDGVIVKTIVTGNLGSKIAAAYGIATVETLTGFKFIGEKIREFEEQGNCRFLFGYEESYGFLAGTFVRDKDAVMSSALIAEMTAYHRQKGKTLPEVLEDLFQEYGYHREEMLSLVLPEDKSPEAMLDALSGTDLQEIAGIEIAEIRDYRTGKAWEPHTGKEHALLLPLSDALFFALADGSWFCIRPSGTEPKVKLYFAVVAASSNVAAKKMDVLKAEVMQKIGNCFSF